MSFGKPRLTDTKMLCLACAETFPEHNATLEHAGRTTHGDYWNTKCPHCGTRDYMEELDGRPKRQVLHERARTSHEVRKRQKRRRN